MASADFLQFVVTALCFEYVYSSASARPPRVSSITFTSCICCIYAPEFGQYWTLFCLGNSSVPSTPCMQFLFVRPRFCPRVSILPASGFLQIPPHDGHPCLRLTVPTAKSVADFHRQVIAHAERTKRRRAGTVSDPPGAALQNRGVCYFVSSEARGSSSLSFSRMILSPSIEIATLLFAEIPARSRYASGMKTLWRPSMNANSV